MTMLAALASGFATTVAVAIGFLLWTRLPPHVVCPRCSAPTTPLRSRGPGRVTERFVWARWCAECDWSGLGRRGPKLDDGPVDHRSGFRWSGPSETAPMFQWGRTQDRAGTVEAGFEWREPPGRTTPPPAHPSGFRWAEDLADRGPRGTVADEEASGFRWQPAED